MQIDTFLKLGSLAFGVAQDEKVRELAGLIHNGAKRRGVFGPYPGQPQSTSSGAGQSGIKSVDGSDSAAQAPAPAPVPFAPGKPAAPAKSAAPAPQAQPGPAIPGTLNKYLTADNAKKALGMVGQVANMLIK